MTAVDAQRPPVERRAASPASRPNGTRLTAEERAEVEGKTVALLLSGATFDQIRAEVGITAPTIVRIRRDAGLPASGRGRRNPPPRSIDDALAAAIEAGSDGHARWSGPMAGRMPQLFAEGDRFNARHVIFERHHGRPPVGYVRSDCGDQACVAGAHLTDDVLRNASPEEPVTIRALADLLDEIDREGGPQAARDNRLRLQTEESPMAMATADAPAVRTAAVRAAPPAVPTAPGPATGRSPSEALPTGKLLKWAEDHPDTDVQATAQRTRAALTGLRNRYDADHELAELDTEAEQLEQRLAELRARRQELAPAKPRKKHTPDPDAPAARTWAKANGVDCPGTGRVPKAVMDAWRAAADQPAH
ncbi:histone-like nucleoid-structuring protein Lsr2 [Streptomyces sp. NPDC050263]|uniref:Lsr2 family DNA-binding protein n=1 Tax=Streptomyces sp. NPDC050263 TaxID=3155037 RepID=UPI00341D8265